MPIDLPSMAQAACALRSGQLDSVSLVEACFERERESHQLNAYQALYAEEALAVAHAQHTLLEQGHDLGPLHGLPIALKGNIAVAGKVMNAGSRILANHVASRDARVVTRLKRAGAILLGMTNLHEFAWGGTTANPHYGATHNAIDPRRIPAGSSGGSGVAVASGAALAALGTDTGGSVRLPASMNGIVGLRPTFDAVSCEGVFPLAATLDTVGPMAPSVADCEWLFDVIREPAAKPSVERQLPERPTLALIRDHSLSDLDAEVDLAFRAFLARAEANGCRIIEIELPALTEVVNALVVINACEPLLIHDRWLKTQPQDYGADVRRLLEGARLFTAHDYLSALRFKRFMRHALIEALAGVDALITPMLPFTVPLAGQEKVMLAGKAENIVTANMQFTGLASLGGVPALSLPIGHSREGLPIGGQLIGSPNQERALFALGKRLELVS